MIKISSRGGDFSKTAKFMQSLDPHYIYNRLDKYGKLGVEALREATPKDTGLTSESWNYEVYIEEDSARIEWTNSNINEGVPVALMIQYGHGMPNGGYVKGMDYINPALKPIFQAIQTSIWEEVKSK